MNEDFGASIQARFDKWLQADEHHRHLTPEEKGKERAISEDFGPVSSKKRRVVTDRLLMADAGAGKGGPSSSAPAAKRPRKVNRKPSFDQSSSETSSSGDS